MFIRSVSTTKHVQQQQQQQQRVFIWPARTVNVPLETNQDFANKSLLFRFSGLCKKTQARDGRI